MTNLTPPREWSGNPARGGGGDSSWVREMRRRHALIAANCGCTVWDESAAAAAEALLPMVCDWLTRRGCTS